MKSGRNLEMAERKTEYIFAEAATAFVLIAVLGVAGITAGRSGIAKSSEVESVRAKAEANKVEEQEQENAEKKQETQTEEVIADGQYQSWDKAV